MEKEAKRFLFYLLVILLMTFFLLYRYNQENSSDIVKDFTGLAYTLIMSSSIGCYEILNSNGKYFLKVLKCKLLIPNKKVYVSLSYLLRIKLSGSEKYLLVKGNKIDQYQPVGGVYKLVGNKCINKDWNAEFKADINNIKDLRFFVNAKYIPDVIKWFKSGYDREIGVWREFYEELIETKIIRSKNFKSIRVEKLKSVDKFLIKENRFRDETYHTLIYDIYSVELNQKQFDELEILMNDQLSNELYAFVTKDDIEKECFDNSSKRIGQHTKYTI